MFRILESEQFMINTLEDCYIHLGDYGKFKLIIPLGIGKSYT